MPLFHFLHAGRHYSLRIVLARTSMRNKASQLKSLLLWQNPREWSKSESQKPAVGLEGHVKTYLLFCVSISEFFKFQLQFFKNNREPCNGDLHTAV
jgi:hypothetical protein